MEKYRYLLIYKKIKGIVNNFDLNECNYLDATPKRTKLKISNLHIYDFALGNYYAKKKIALKIKKIHNKLIDILTNDEDDDESAVLTDIDALNELMTKEYIYFLTQKYFLKMSVRLNAMKMNQKINISNQNFEKFSSKKGRKI